MRPDNGLDVDPYDAIAVHVILLNDAGDRETMYAWGDTVDDAVRFAEETIREITGDDSFVMTDWSAG